MFELLGGFLFIIGGIALVFVGVIVVAILGAIFNVVMLQALQTFFSLVGQIWQITCDHVRGRVAPMLESLAASLRR